MSRKNNILLLIAILIAVSTALAVKSRMNAHEQAVAVQAPPTTKILVVKRDVPVGNFIQTQDLSWEPWPAEGVQPIYIKEGADQITAYNGAIARRALRTGEPVTAEALVKPGAGGFLSAVLEQGKRAMSVSVSAASGASGFIFPGDRVDVVVTHKITYTTPGLNSQEQKVISDTFVRDVRVVAVDQMLDNPENKAIVAKTVTLEVTPEQAERIAVAQEMGVLSLTLRSLATDAQRAAQAGAADATGTNSEASAKEDPLLNALQTASTPSVDKYTRDSDVSPALERTKAVLPRVLVIRGEQRENYMFVQDSQDSQDSQ